ncbi:MAG: polysaccharide biosynthesis tyrosine autokinase [Geminicoccaceae bacterium]|nr:polysaccharide biosynthesis tyrosine autokinase [Geminicoccaceae bacterium]
MRERVDHPEAASAERYYGAPQEPSEGGTDLRGLLAFLRRRRGLILGVTLVGTFAAGYWGFSRKPVYTAQALVKIEPKEAKIVDIQAVAAGLSADAATVETQIRLIQSRAMLDQLVERLALVDKDAPLPPSRTENAVAGWLADTIGAWLPQDWLFATGLAQEQADIAPELAYEVAKEQRIDQLMDGLRVKQEGRSLVLSINYTSPSPAEAARIANALADLYIAAQVQEKAGITQKATEWLEIRVAELQEQVVQGEAEIEQYRAKYGLYETKGGLTLQGQQIMNLTQMLVQARAERSEKESRLRYIRDLQNRRESLNTLSEVMNSPYMTRLWEQERELQKSEAELLSTFGEKHPRVQLLKAEQAKVAEKIRAEVQRIVDNTANEIRVLQARERSIEQDIARLMNETDKAGQAEIKLRELERQVAVNRALYEQFLQRLKETREQQQLAAADAKVVARAKPPESPSSRPPLFWVLAGFLVSSLAGTGLAWAVERLDNTIRSGKEIERLFGLPCLGLVPYVAPSLTKKHGGLAGYIVAKPLSIYAEAIRQIFTALRLSNIDRPPRVIQVTSSVPAEGKTTLAISLATALAQAGHKVVLVDLDIRHPSIGRELGTKALGRLVEYMAGDASAEELIYPVSELGIDVISVDRQSANPGAIIGSQRMKDLLASLRERYDYVVLDSTPVLGVTDSKLTAELADSVLFVVRWEKTTKDVAEDALKQLVEYRIPLGGCVITQVNVKKHARYGYGGVDHYYSKYHKYYVN